MVAPTATAAVNLASPWVVFGFPLLIVVLIVGSTWLLFMRRSAASPSGPKAAEVPDTRFADVAGADDAVAELAEIVDMMTHPDHYKAAGARRPRGALLVGPPGTGKTLLARAVAGEAGVPFYAVSGSSFVDRYVGVGASKVRALFKKAASHTGGAIVFIDEIDAIGGSRGPGADSTTEHEATLNELLVALDGFEQSEVVVLAATNMPDSLDPALLRPGRLERQVSVPLPDRRGRVEILSTHVRARGVHLDTGLDLTRWASRTPGMSGAELERVVNEAALCAARRWETQVTARDLDSAVATVTLGRESSSRMVSETDRRITAWHEAGHAVAALTVEGAPPPAAVTILPRGGSGGSTHMHGSESMYSSRTECVARLVVAMGGRAGEERLLDGEYTSGASGDLVSATRLAAAMVASFGMREGMLASRSASVDALLGSDEKFRGAVEDMLAQALASARNVVSSHGDRVDAVAAALLEHETLGEAQLYEVAGLPAPPALT